MSHNVKMSGLSVSDMKIMDQAIKELNSEYGTDMSLTVGTDTSSRNYARRSVLPGTVAVINMGSTASYDVTLTSDPSGLVSMQTEAMNIATLQKVFGVGSNAMNISSEETVSLANTGYRQNEQLGMQSALGRIVQRYGIIAMEQEAALKGKSCSRHFDSKTGVMSVSVTI